MSLDATRWAWLQDVRPTHKLVLLSLADRAGESNECHPSIARLEKDTGLYRETIMEAVAHMETSGLIKVTRRHGAGNKYTLIGVAMRENQSVKADQSAKPDQYGKADRTSREKPTTTSREKPTQNLPIEPTKNLSNNSGFDAAAYLSGLGVSGGVINDWLVLRKKKRAPATLTAIEDIEAEAVKAGYTLEKALKTCCAKGWQGFDSEWVKPRNQPTKQSNRDSYAAEARAADERLNGGSHEPTERDITGQCSIVA